MERLTRYDEYYKEYDRKTPRVTNKELINKLAEYEDLEEQGKLLKLPCAVGDTVWIIKNPGEVSRYQIFQICISPDQTYFCCYGDCFKLDQINKTVFSTREEAWAAMKKIQG